jgi:hypothetical protein
MITAASARPSPAMPDTAPQALLVVSLENFDVRYASHRAVEWLALPAERLLGRSLLLSLPQVGQALSLLVQAGLSPAPALLNVTMATPDGAALNLFAHRRDNEAIIEFRAVDDPVPAVGATRPGGLPDPVGFQRRLDELRQDLVAMRARIPCDEAMLRGDDPMLFWLWQAEAALAQLSRRYPDLVAIQRKPTGTFRRTP